MSSIKTNNARLFIEVTLVICLCCFPLFYRLDTLPIRQWDEARNAVSAIEMLQNKNYVVRYFNGEPDYFDVKPPLLIWMQVLSIKLVGLNELAIRLPSAIAALLTAIFLIIYFHKYNNNRYAGYLASLILVTSHGYINGHLARTGDHDALLVLFITMAVFLYYEFLKSEHTNNSLLFQITFVMVLGVFTKGVAVLMILPGLLVMTLLFGRLQRLLRNKWFYTCILLFLVVCGFYYALRESWQSGYLKAVWTGELFPRYLNTSKAFLKESALYYISNFITGRFSYWIYFLLPAVITLAWQGLKEKRSFSVYLLINALVFLVIISAGSKNIWYDGPLYPLLSTITALFLLQMHKFSKQLLNNTPLICRTAAVVILVTVFIYPGITIMKKVKRSAEFFWDEEIYSISYVLRDLHNSPLLAIEPVSIAFDGYNGHFLFYTQAIAYKYGKVIKVKSMEELRNGDYVLVSQESMINQIGSKFSYELTGQINRVSLIRVKESLISSHRQ